MRKLLKTLVVLITIFCLNVPAFAGTFNFGNYTPPDTRPTGLDTIMQDANNFIREYYNLPESGGDYFTPTTLVKNNSGNVISVPICVQEDYNVSDIEVASLVSPILYYEKPGGGPERDKIYLGQTKGGHTITNVRYPLRENWSFLEDLNWLPYGDEYAREWWGRKYNSLPDLYEVNEKANENPEFAKLLDTCIGIAVVPQVRHWGGQQYYQSKAAAGHDGKPGIVGQPYNFKPELALLFPWHKYVNVLMPPTYNTWGFGIGFYIHDGVYKYKSFPICPLFMGLMPDFYPTPEGETQWRPEFRDAENENITTYYYEPGDTEIPFPVNLFNQGEKAITDFRAVWFGKGDDPEEGWQGSNPAWQADEMN